MGIRGTGNSMQITVTSQQPCNEVAGGLATSRPVVAIVVAIVLVLSTLTPAARSLRSAGALACPAARSLRSAGALACPAARSLRSAGALACPAARSLRSAGALACPAARSLPSAGALAWAWVCLEGLVVTIATYLNKLATIVMIIR